MGLRKTPLRGETETINSYQQPIKGVNMKTFDQDYGIVISVSKTEIKVESYCLSFDDSLDTLNNCTDQDYQAEIAAVMPEDYELIMVEEDCGVLFAAGSPQICECNWKITYEITDAKTTLTITGFR